MLFTASDDFDQLHKGNFPRNIPEDRRRLEKPMVRKFTIKSVNFFPKSECCS